MSTTMTAPRGRTTKDRARAGSNGRAPADQAISRLSSAFKLLSDKSRLKIVLALAQTDEMHVGAICDLVGQTQPAVSHHLTLMRMGGLLNYRRDGKNNFYYLDCGTLGDIVGQVFADHGNGQAQIDLGEFVITCKRKR